MPGCGLRDVVVDHAGLDHGDVLLGVQADDLVHAVQGDHDPARDRQRAARQRRAAAARDEGDALAVTEAHGLDHLVLGLGEDHGLRARPKGGERVGLERRQLRGRGEQAPSRIELAEG